MSLNLPSRRVLATASSSLRGSAAKATVAAARSSSSSSSSSSSPSALVLRQRRSAAAAAQPPAASAAAAAIHTTAARSIDWRGLFGRKKKPDSSKPSDDMFDFERSQNRKSFKDRMTDSHLDANPMLASEMEQAEQAEDSKDGAAPPRRARRRKDLSRNELGTSMLREDLQRALDPDPRSRVRWERKMVMQHVSRMLDPKGAETKEERLARTERTLMHKSTRMATSTKKLVHLAHQIAGKTLEDALVQMRFSKKKMAKEIIWQLEEARDLAVVERGMGLGHLEQASEAAATAGEEGGEAAAAAAAAANKAPFKIQTKDGRWLMITDPTRIYIDQAWVGKGPWRAAQMDYRARGQRFIKWSPSAYLSIVLKEEKTRIRRYDEKLAKEAKKAPWVHLPNRPVTAQRPYYTW